MASGPEHYRAAEACIQAATQMVDENQGRQMDEHDAVMLHFDIAGTIASAQVHATLALAAATLAATHADAVPSGTHEDWWGVMGGAR